MSVFQLIPETQREAACSAAVTTFGTNAVSSLQHVGGGASGALTYRLEANGKPYFMRIETHRGSLRNPHQYTCMRAAAEAGIAPPVLYVGEAEGIAIMSWVEQRPLKEYPGGPVGLAQAAGKLISKLQQEASFPEFGDHRNFIGGLLSYLQRACSPGLLSPHAEVLGRIREAYPWDTAQHLASHNDLNPGNILFDGDRLWLIDWETSYRNDPVTDIAIVAENFARTSELEAALLLAWLGQTPDPRLRARVTLMRRWTRLYYAGLLFATAIKPGSEPITDLAAPNPEQFRTLMGSGQLKIGAAETRVIFGKVMLAAFLDGTQTKDFDDTLDAARA